MIKYNELLEKSNDISIQSVILFILKILILFLKINTNFHNDKMPEKGSNCICLSVISSDSVFKIGKNYYPQMFLKEFKYIVKKIK